MVHIEKKIGLVFLLVCSVIATIGQTSYENLAHELVLLQEKIVPDKRVAILDIELKNLEPGIIISGETDLPKAKKQIFHFLRGKNIQFIDSVRILPDSSLGDQTWALAKLSVSNLRAEPDHASELVSQLLMGTPMKVLDRKNNWYRIQTPEYYIGWMDSAGLQRITSREMKLWEKSDRYLFSSLSGLVYDNPGLNGNTISDLVPGDMFEVQSKEAGFLKIRMPDGHTGYVSAKDCISYKQWCNKKPDPQSLITIAGQMLGFPYLWGGVSSKAMDCSGLVKLAFYLQGIIVPRDASQQAACGDTLDFRNLNNLLPGDLLFFGASAQKITHVGIYLGKGDFIHASGKVSIGSIIPGDPKFNPARNIVAASRFLEASRQKGIVRVKNHPWYQIQH